ncbi:metabotropic glutamate receptor 3-like isoform X2 [Paramacrobiotus metropolitanus]|uniref:metabotropic glutamate receptor 3-like isoform X2 n=1 Tax=Paramacrobiotus metropolitanus TaxID=2943436 RepID=UPI0024463BA4|nr:metabotropic glutamate receptor 3-like isoform X2 [Paramacrobiotus metropolitanus]
MMLRFLYLVVAWTTTARAAEAPWSGETVPKSVHYPGDVLLGGLFALHAEYNVSSGQCRKLQEADGVVPLEATLYYLQEINRAGILPFTLGLLAFDTCDSHSFALEQALHFIHSHTRRDDAGSSGAATKDLTCEEPAHRMDHADGGHFNVERLAGIITGLPSSVTVSLAQLLRLFRMPQISFMSTSPLLSDRIRYDYFFRTVPSDVNQVRAIIALLKFYSWHHLSIVYSDDEYGNRGLHELEQLASNHSLCIANKLKMPTVSEYERLYTSLALFDVPYEHILKQLLNTDTNIVVIFADYKSAYMLFETVHRLKPSRDFVWIGSDAWGGREEVINDHPEVSEGAITVQLNTRELHAFSQHYSGLRPTSATCARNPFFCRLWQQCSQAGRRRRHPRETAAECGMLFGGRGRSGAANHPGVASVRSSGPVAHVDSIRDAVYAYAYALKDMHRVKCGVNASGLCPAMRLIQGADVKLHLTNVSFTEPGGSSFRFYHGSEGQPRYTIMNLQSLPSAGRQPAATGHAAGYQWKEVGKYSLDEERGSTLILNRSAAQFKHYQNEFPSQLPCKTCDIAANEVRIGRGDACCSKCLRCELWQYPHEKTCRNCPEGHLVNLTFLSVHRNRSLFDESACAPVEAVFLDYDSLYAAPVLAVSIAGLIGTCICACVLLAHHMTPIVKAAGREHLGVLFGALLGSYAMNFIILHRPTAWSCVMVRFLGVLYALCNSALLIKIARIYRIFNTQECHKTQKLKYISPRSQLALTGMFVFIEVVIIAVWTCFEPPAVLAVYPTRYTRELVCSDLHDLKLLSGLCYPLMLLFPMAYLAFRTRTCPAAFSEAKYTGYGIYLTFINVLTFVLIYIGNNAIPIRVITVCIGLCLNASVILVTTFVTKVYIILFRPYKNSKERIMGNGRLSTGRHTYSAGMNSITNLPTCSACRSLLNAPSNAVSSRHQSNPELSAPLSHNDILKALEMGDDTNKPRSRTNTIERDAHTVI